MAKPRRRSRRYAAGITSIDSSGAVIIPPTIGAAIRCITSAPVPWLSMMGKSPAMITATVIAFGRTRSTAPSSMASRSSASVAAAPALIRSSQALRR